MTTNKLMLNLEQQEFICNELQSTINQLKSSCKTLADEELFGFTTEIVGSMANCCCYLKRIQKQLSDYIETQKVSKQ